MGKRLKRIIASLALFLIFSALAARAQASCCTEQASEFDDIYLVRADFDGANIMYFSFQGGKPRDDRTRRNARFIKRCVKGNYLFISELGGRKFTCKITEKNDEFYRAEAVALNEASTRPGDNTKRSDDQIFTISFTPLPVPAVRPEALSKEEIRSIDSFLKDTIKKPRSRYGEKYVNVIGRENIAFVEGIPAERPIKINVNGQQIYFVPSFLIETDLDADILTSVVLNEKGQYKLLGTITGCIQRFGADLDGDGYPEVITRLCSPNEYVRYTYYRYFPSVKSYVWLQPG